MELSPDLQKTARRAEQTDQEIGKMTRFIPAASLIFFMSAGAFAQNQANRPEFDVAEIKLNTSGGPSIQSILPGQFTLRNLALGNLVQLAYKVRAEYIVEAPAWFASDKFDIVAKAPPDTNRDTMMLMLQTLLEDRFKLVTHKEPRPMDVFALTVGKGGPKLQKSAEPGGKLDCKKTVDFKTGVNALNCRNMTMADLAEALPNNAWNYIDRMVVDQTGLEGAYDIKLEWVGIQVIDQGGLTMFDALQKYLGLKADGKKLPMPVLVIDHAETLAN
jgi:uncharacterized protein (TIGR03435 family)